MKKQSNPPPNFPKPPPPPSPPRLIEGTWPKACIQRAFVDGAKWWQFHHNGSTMFGSERDEAEAEAIRRYGNI
jgi:hypothetical protein